VSEDERTYQLRTKQQSPNFRYRTREARTSPTAHTGWQRRSILRQRTWCA
jgi:hypothetical protein